MIITFPFLSHRTSFKWNITSNSDHCDPRNRACKAISQRSSSSPSRPNQTIPNSNAAWIAPSPSTGTPNSWLGLRKAIRDSRLLRWHDFGEIRYKHDINGTLYLQDIIFPNIHTRFMIFSRYFVIFIIRARQRGS